MEVIIKSANFKASKQLEKLIIEKVNKLFHHSNNIIQALVVLREEEKKSHENKSCEIKLVVPGYDHFAKNKTDSYEKSITQAVGSLQNVILKTKKRAIAKRHSHNPIS